jgi:hypothetical protein
VAFFVLIIVGLVVGQTWLDWRDTKQNWVVPDWAKGTALAGIIAVSLAAASSFASVWIQDGAGPSNAEFGSRLFWPELALLICTMAVVVFAVRKKRLRLMLMLAAVALAAFWVGMALLT